MEYDNFSKEELLSKIATLEKDLFKAEQNTQRLIDAEEHNRFQASILNAVKQAVIVTLPNGEIIYWSPFAEQVYGWSDEEVLGQNIMNITVPQLSHKRGAEIMGQLNTGKSWSGEFYVQHKNGTTFPVLITDTPVINEQGELNAIIGVSIDISERKQSEQKIKISEQRFRNVLDANPFPVAVVDEKDQNIAYWSKSAQKLFGHIPKTTDEWHHLAYPDPEYRQEVINKWKPLLEKARNAEGAINTGIYKIACKDGLVKICEIYAQFIPGYLIVTLNDITEKKLDENKILKTQFNLAKAQDLGKIGTWELDIKNDILFWTDESYKILGVPVGTAMTYDLFFNCIHPDDRDFVNQEWKSKMMTNNYDIEHRIIVDDNIKWVREKAEITFDEKGQPIKAIGFIQDITERKQAETELKKQRDLFELVINSVPSSIFWKDLNSVYMGCNSHFAQAAGLCERERVIGKDDKAMIWKKDADVYRANDQEVIRTGIPMLNFEDYFVNAEGENVWWKTNKTPLIGSDGKIFGILGTAEDITQQKQINSALRKSEHRFRFLAENAKDMIYRMSIPDAVYEYVSPASIEIFGHTPEVFYNTPLLIQHAMHPDWVEYFRTEWQNSINGKVPPFYEYQIIHKSGEVKWLNQRNVLIKDEKGKPIALEAVVTDITQRKQMEEALVKNQNRYKKAQEIGGVGNWEFDPISTHFWASDEARKIYGYDLDVEDFTTEMVESCIPDRERVHQALIDLIEQGKEYNLIFDIITYDTGIRKTIHSIAELEKDAKGDIIKITGVLSDITKQKKADELLIKAKEQAEESDRLKSAFLANMSHEIRTPMNGILGFTSLLKEPNLSGRKQKKFIDIIEKSGARMLSTINDIIDISKIESGQIDVIISDINLNKQMDELLEFFMPEAMAKNIQLSITSRLPDQQANCKSDKGKLNSILINFIKNAIKYTPAGTIDIGYSIIQKENVNKLEFYVKDTGIGIPKKRLNAVFNRFVQADIDDRQAFEGSGLGLAISKAYVEMLGGKIWAESEEGVGSQFYFTIPLLTTEKEISEVKTENPGVEPIIKKGLKILVVDDDEIVLTYLHVVLQKYQQDLLVAKTGIEAVEICRDNKDIDVILMDIKMPGFNGYEATRQIREFNKDVFIIAQTAYAQPGDREKCIQAGCDDYISKPINKEKLLEIISNHFLSVE